MKKSICLILSFCFIQNLNAQSKENYYFPYITGNILTEYNFTRMDSGSSGNSLYNDNKNLSYLQIESNLNIHIYDNFSINTNTIFRPVNDRYTDVYSNDYYGQEDYLKRKNYINKYDVIFEELAFQYKEEEFLIGAGKFNPTFGTAYDKSKYYSTFGTKIAEDYELTEKLGIYIAMTLPMFTLRGNIFYNDDTFLSSSLFGNRDTYSTEKGVANNKDLENFSLTADFAVNDYRINLGVRRLKADSALDMAEKGYVIGFEKLVEESVGNFGFLPFAEYSLIQNYNGTKNRNMNFLTFRLPIIYNNWNLTASYSAKLDREDGFKDYKSYLAQIGIGYKFKNGIMIDVSKTKERESYKIDSLTKTSFNVDSTDIRISYMLVFDDK